MAATGKSGSSGGSKGKKKTSSTRSRKTTASGSASKSQAKRTTSRTGAGHAGSARSSTSTGDIPRASETPVAEFDRPYLWRAFIRLVAMLLYGIIGYVVLLLYFVLAAVQFAIDFVAGRPNTEIRDFMSRLNAWLAELLDYLGFQRDVEDFPFPHPGSPFPGPRKEKP